MQRVTASAGAGLLALALTSVAGCAVHPLPEDISGVPTSHIVRQIRCETRDAVIHSIVGFLGNAENMRFNRLDASSNKIGLYYKEHPDEIHKFRPTMLSGSAKQIVSLIWNTGIAYNYNLEMTETNNNDGALNLLKVLPTSNRMLGLSAKLDLERQNTRVFTATDTFGKLVTDIDAGDPTFPRYCSDKYLVDENRLYPLTGKIGMRPVIQEFVVLAIFDNLSGDASKDFTKADGPAQMAEQLEFTTTIDLSATPKVTFSPVGTALRVADVSFTAEAIRKDLHKLTIGLYVQKTVTLDAIRGGVLGNLSAAPFGSLASAPVRNNAEAGALAAVNQALTLKLFQIKPQVIVQ